MKNVQKIEIICKNLAKTHVYKNEWIGNAPCTVAEVEIFSHHRIQFHTVLYLL